MSLKDKLRSLIEATFTSKKAYISSQAMPDAITIDLTGFNSSQHDYVAPTDGFACVRYNGSAESVECDVYCNTSGLRSLASNNNGWTASWIQVKKGTTVTYRSTGDTASNRQFLFSPTIGGGYLSSLAKSLCGGGLCLLSHLSKRFSSSAAVKQCRQMNERHRRLPQTEIGYILLPLMMVISRFQHQATGETPIHLRLRTHQVKSYTKSQQSLPRMLAHLSFVKKVTQSMFLSEEQQVLAGIPEPLSSLWGNRSFCKGGAL